MFGPRVTLFRLFGFAVRVDASWLIIALLVTWSLAAGLFPQFIEGFSTTTYWLMGIAGALGLFASIVLHELGHSLMARKYGVEMRGITLFIFGGVAEMDREPESAEAELMVAIAGPIVSVALALGFWGAGVLGEGAGLPKTIWPILNYLGVINGVLVAFNIIPAFPLDGGRVLRAALWAWKGSLMKATKITSTIGQGFAFLLIALAILQLFTGNFIGAMWWFLLGMFLRGAAQMSYQQLVFRKALEGEPVRRFMRDDPVTVPDSISLDEFVQEYVYRHHFKMFPVVSDGELLGCINTKQVKEIPREEWGSRTVHEVARRCTDENTVGPDEDAMKVLSRMNRSGESRMMVVDDGELAGVITLKDLLGFLSMKIEMEEE